MNTLRRALAQIARSQSTAKRIVLHPIAPLTQPYSTKAKQSSKAGASAKAAWKAVDWPRPSEIPFEEKVANSVNLIGYVDAPIQFRTSPDGKHWAGTIITHNASSNSPPLWIPVLFEGDLAHIAASHLKNNDHVRIAGQLTADPPAADGNCGQANLQVVVHSLNFIEASSETRKSFTSKMQEVETIDHSAGTKKDGNSASSGWRDLLDNPEQWQDYRSKKLQGLVKPRYPDFKCTGSGLALWLDSAPNWVLSELDGVKFDVQSPESKNAELPRGDEFWRDLVENPDKWWDSRLDKKSEKAPDFKHKETGKALWLAYSPAWVKSELLPVKRKRKAATGKRDTPVS